MDVAEVLPATLDDLNARRRWADANPSKECPFRGKLFKVADADYFAFDAANQSLLAHYDDSPAHARARMLRHDSSDTPALAFGRAVHCALFENDKFPHLYAVREAKPKEPERPAELANVTRQSKAGKEAIAAWEATWRPEYETTLAAWEAQQQGKTFLKEEEFEAIYQITGKTLHDPFIRQFVEFGLSEITLIARHPEYRVWMKAKIDNLLLEKHVIVDLKTTRDTVGKFRHDLFKKNYEVQAAYYRDITELVLGWKVRANIILSVEKYPPYEPNAIMLSAEAIELGREIYRRQLAQHALCLATNRWDGYERKVHVAEPPQWKLNREFRDVEGDE